MAKKKPTDFIALYHIKGGVGKTAAAVNLAYLAAKDGHQSLLCDLDPQASASFYFRIRAPKRLNARRLLKGGRAAERSIRGTDFDRLDLLPADMSFRNLDVNIDRKKRSRKRLGSALRPLSNDYRLVFLDAPPNITLLSENIFRVADRILVPVIPTTLAVMTYDKLVRFFEENKLDRDKLHPFFSMVEKRKRMHGEIIERFSEEHPGMMTTRIPYLSDVEKMGIYRTPIEEFARRSPAAAAYRALWAELKRMLEIADLEDQRERPTMPQSSEAGES